MAISTHLDTVIRSAIGRRLRLSRVGPYKPWDDEAVTAIADAVEREQDGAARPDGLVTADGPEAAAALAALKERSEETLALAAEMFALFTRGSNGWNARAKTEKVEQWRESLERLSERA